MTKSRLIIVLAIQFAQFFCTKASVLYVSATGTNPVAPYSSWNTGATSIQAAVDAANPGDLIMVTNGIYNAGTRISTDGTTNRVAVPHPVTLQSVNGAAVTIIDGLDLVRCFYLTNGATAAGFTMTNGIAGYGGGVYWRSVQGINYFVQRATNSSAPFQFMTLQTNLGGLANTTTYNDVTATNPGPYFYRVGVP